MKQPLEGQLYKYTNVMKGWQHRWFMLNPESGTLEYYMSEEFKRQKPRGGVSLLGAVISPSDEDSQTFTLNSAGGEVYKLRALDAKERQHWVNRLRSVAEYHTNASAQVSSLPRRDHHHSMGTLASGGPSPQETHASLLRAQQRITCNTASLYDAFRAVREILLQVEQNHHNLGHAIEVLPSSGERIKCIDPELLILKATSYATLMCMEQCLSILQQQQHAMPFQQTRTVAGGTMPTVKRQFGKGDSPSNPAIASSASPVFMRKSRTESVVSSVLEKPSGSSVAVPRENDDEVTDCDEYSDSELGPVEEHKSIILHVLSQLKLGMDLTRVVLPTFILERRSLLEMFADFLGHPDLFLSITDHDTSESRMLAMLEWYLTSFHVGRKGDIAKKPYNPIIGETFTCSWNVAGDSPTKVRYIAEQVSHHPPMTAFYVECPQKAMCLNAHVWTRSKFMGMSIGVNMIGDATLFLGQHGEEYTFTLPSAYARSILTVPWVEMGGKVAINCAKTGYLASIVFHTKPFYGGKLHRVTAEVKNSLNVVVCRVQGEWNGALEFTYPEGNAITKAIDTNQLNIYKKRVRPIPIQSEMESRKLWSQVTSALKEGDVEQATTHKRYLEERQRAGERHRLEEKQSFPTRFFRPDGEGWVYNEMLIRQ